MTMTNSLAAFAGFGLGLRHQHYAAVLHEGGAAALDFVEVISENFMVDGGRPLATLDAVRALLPVALHGVSMNIGAVAGVDPDYLRRLRSLADRIDPLWVSDHLCWTGIDGANSHDLLPLPYTHEALDLVCDNIQRAQDALARPMLFENPSSYLMFGNDGMTEWEFLAAMSQRTGCFLLLDINNIFVSCTNHGLDADAYLDAIPADRVRQIHLAGHSHGRDLLIDTHDAPVCEGVWALLSKAIPKLGPVAVMIERDDAIPPFGDLVAELNRARAVASAATSSAT